MKTLHRVALAVALVIVLTGISVMTPRAATAAVLTPPDPHFPIAVNYHGKTFWKNEEGYTATGAVPIDAELGFTPPAKGYARGPLHHLPNCAQPPVQAVRDHATFTEAELALYGMPTVRQVGNREEWLRLVRHADTRVCDTYVGYLNGKPVTRSGSLHENTPKSIGNYSYYTSNYTQNAWIGWMSTAKAAGFPYPLTGAEGYVTPPGQFTITFYGSTASMWLGVGGWGTSNACGSSTDRPALVQAGVDYTYLTFNTIHDNPFIENTGWAANCYPQNLNYTADPTHTYYVNLGCGTYACNYVYLEDTSGGSTYFGAYMGGPAADSGSAQCILEKDNSSYTLAEFSSYGPVNFSACRTSYFTGTQQMETGIGNLAPSLIDELDSTGSAYCAWATNFSDSSNSTFNVYRASSTPGNC